MLVKYAFVCIPFSSSSSHRRRLSLSGTFAFAFVLTKEPIDVFFYSRPRCLTCRLPYPHYKNILVVKKALLLIVRFFFSHFYTHIASERAKTGRRPLIFEYTLIIFFLNISQFSHLPFFLRCFILDNIGPYVD